MKRFLPLLIVPLLSFAHEEEKAPSFPRPPEKEITVEAQPWVKNCIAEPYVEADFLYWKVAEEGVAYAASGFSEARHPIEKKGKVHTLDFEGSPGFRVGLGLNLAHDGWDVMLRYTWMYTHASDQTSAPTLNYTLQPVWLSGPGIIFQQGLVHAYGRWNIHFNVVDFEWGRNFYISRFLTLRPFFGLKGHWMDQNYIVRYTGFANQSDDDESNIPVMETIRSDIDTWGIGVRLGLNTSWYFVKNWSVFGDVAFSSCWSHFDVSRKDVLDEISTGSRIPIIHSDLDNYAIMPVLELATGVRWEMWFAEDSMHALIQAGWEEQVWWGANRHIAAFMNDQGKGNLMTQGLTLRFRFDF